MARIKEIIREGIIILKKDHLTLKKRVNLWFSYNKLVFLRLFHGRMVNLDNKDVVVVGFRIKYIGFSDFYWTFREIFINEDYKFITNNKRPKVIDAGANLGLFSIYIKWLYPDATIKAFEPQPDTYKYAKENIEGNNLDNVELLQLGLSSNEEKVSIYGEKRAATISRGLYENDRQKRGKGFFEIDVVRLSKYINSTYDFVKLDIEGAEGSVVQDLEESDKLQSIKYLVIEYHKGDEENNDYEKIIQALSKSTFDVKSEFDSHTNSQITKHFMIYAKK